MLTHCDPLRRVAAYSTILVPGPHYANLDLLGSFLRRGVETLPGSLPGVVVRPEGEGVGLIFGDHVVAYYEQVRDRDLYVSYVLIPPQIDRSKPAHQQVDPTLYAGVVEERDGGIVVSGAQVLGTGAPLSDEVFLSSIVPQLRDRGLSETDIRLLVVDNPANVLAFEAA